MEPRRRVKKIDLKRSASRFRKNPIVVPRKRFLEMKLFVKELAEFCREKNWIFDYTEVNETQTAGDIIANKILEKMNSFGLFYFKGENQFEKFFSEGNWNPKKCLQIFPLKKSRESHVL